MINLGEVEESARAMIQAQTGFTTALVALTAPADPPVVTIDPMPSMGGTYGTMASSSEMLDCSWRVNCIGIGVDHARAVRDRVMEAIQSNWALVSSVIGEPVFRAGETSYESGTLWKSYFTVELKVSA